MASRLLSTAILAPPCSATSLRSRTFTKLKFSFNLNPLSSTVSFRTGSVRCRAVGDWFDRKIYRGTYGTWRLNFTDIREVVLYRSGLATAAVSFVLAASAAFVPDDYSLFNQIIRQNLDLFYALGAGGLGLSLFLIHMYDTWIKRTLQAFWALGCIGSLAMYASLARPAGESLVQYVVNNPSAIWFVGPLFAALTGLLLKEGACYLKLEAGILAFIIPTLLLGHLDGSMGEETKLALLGSWMALFVIFSGRKFTQPIKDDIGDKSVFFFNALSDVKKKALIEKLEQRKQKIREKRRRNRARKKERNASNKI